MKRRIAATRAASLEKGQTGTKRTAARETRKIHENWRHGTKWIVEAALRGKWGKRENKANTEKEMEHA